MPDWDDDEPQMGPQQFAENGSSGFAAYGSGFDSELFGRAAKDWREEQAGRQQRANGPANENRNGHAPELELLNAAVIAEGEPKPRLYIQPDHYLLPINHVILLSGDGGTGKSLIAMQLAIAMVTGSKWLGMEVAQGPVVYFSCEDDVDELHRRIHDICQAEEIDKAELHRLTIIDRVKEGGGLLSTVSPKDGIRPTAMFDELMRRCTDIEPLMVVLDNLANCFAGNENDRVHAQQFISLLRRLAVRADTTILLLSHPSRAGRSSGGESGSTAWNNSVRQRMYLTRPADEAEEGDEVDTDVRVLEVMKANYGPVGTKIGVRWDESRFIAIEDSDAFEGVTSQTRREVMKRLRDTPARSDVRAKDWAGYMVAEVIGLDVGEPELTNKQRTPVQRKNRKRVDDMLARWVRNGELAVRMIKDQGRDPRPTYVVTGGLVG